MNAPLFSGRFVFIDIETTGLDSKTDAIIEIGAVVIENDRETGSYQTLVDPGAHTLSLRIQRLTGIKPENLRGKPGIKAAVAELIDLVGNSPCIAHNAQFEQSFLSQHGFSPAVWLDSIACVAILSPQFESLSLEKLLRETGLRDTESHRGLDDARDTWRVLTHLAHNCRLSPEAWDRIILLLEPADNPWLSVFRWLRERAVSGSSKTESHVVAHFARVIADENSQEAFSPSGCIARVLRLAHRPGQAKMAEAVEMALESDQRRMIEAGTGSGKSLAYLYPAARLAIRKGERIAITTHTKLLQHQVATRELPRLRHLFPGLRWATVKGRDNYLCHHALETKIASIDLLTDADQRFVLSAMIAFAFHPESSGEIDRMAGWIRMRHPVWASLAADVRSSGLTCSGESCPFFDRCFYNRMMDTADAANILVINHSLALRWPLHYPAFDRIIIDEAHTLEDAASSAYGEEISRYDLAQSRRRFWGDKKWKGIFDRLLQVIPATDEHRDLIAQISGLAGQSAVFDALQAQLMEEFTAITFGSDPRTRHEDPDQEEYGRRVDLFECVSEVRLRPVRETVERIVDLLGSTIPVCERALGLRNIWTGSKAFGGSLAMDIGIAVQLTCEQHRILKAIVPGQIEGYCNWVEVSAEKNGKWVLKAQPIDVSRALHESLWKKMKTSVLTSATLTVDRSDQFIRMRLGVNIDNTLQPTLTIPSPFDYPSRMLALAPLDAMKLDPLRKQAYLQNHALLAADMSRIAFGRTMYLSTSRLRAAELAKRLDGHLYKDSIEVLVQKGSSNRESILEELRRERGTVVIGLDSFWEGVDVPGSALVVVIIEKIPFKCIGEPLVKARMEALNRRYHAMAGFTNYLLPCAVLKLRQGAGRLIRDTRDFGIVMLFGGVGKKNYTNQIRRAFPVELQTAAQWRSVKEQCRRKLAEWGLALSDR